jgi:hypothetical protein
MADLRELLLDIADESGGRLTPRAVVDAARPSSHPLHNRFEWDDVVAGERYRRIQAQDLIQSVTVTHTRDDAPDIRVRAFQSVRDQHGFAYRSTDEVVADPLLTRIVLAQMDNEWKVLRERYSTFTEFWDLIRQDLARSA